MGARYYASGMGRWITEDPLPKWLALGGTLDTIYPGGKVFIRIDQSNGRSYLGAVFCDHELQRIVSQGRKEYRYNWYMYSDANPLVYILIPTGWITLRSNLKAVNGNIRSMTPVWI